MNSCIKVRQKLNILILWKKINKDLMELAKIKVQNKIK